MRELDTTGGCGLISILDLYMTSKIETKFNFIFFNMRHLWRELFVAESYFYNLAYFDMRQTIGVSAESAGASRHRAMNAAA